MRKYIYLLFSFLLACSQLGRYDPLDKVDRQYMKYLKSKDGILIVATGGINYGKGLYYHLNVARIVNLEESRKFVLDCINDFNKLIEKFGDEATKKQPVSKLLELTIGFADLDNNGSKKQGIGLVFFAEGEIVYKIHFAKTNSFITIYREALDEAYQKVNSIENFQKT